MPIGGFYGVPDLEAPSGNNLLVWSKPLARPRWASGLSWDGTTLAVTGEITATGQVTSGSNTSTGSGLQVNNAQTTPSDVRWLSAGANRWILRRNTTAEAGADAGSDFQLIARTDAGGTIDTVLQITRAAGGAFAIARPVTIASTLAVTGTITANKDSDYSGNIGGLTTKGVTSPNSAVRVGVTSTPVYFIQANLDGTGSRPLAMQPGGGNLLVGTATDDGSHLLQVNGTSAFAGTMTISSGSTFPGNNVAGLYCTSGDGLIITGGAGTTSSLVLLNNVGQNAVTIEHNGSSVLIGGGNYATTTVTGFLQIGSCAGAPTGTPTGGGLLANAVSLMYDRTNHRLYAYDGAWKSVALT